MTDFLYGKNAILSALLNNRRKFGKLHLYSNPNTGTEQKQQQHMLTDSVKLQQIKRLCAERRVQIQPVLSRNRLSAMIGSSEGMRQHQGVVLECSSLPVFDFNDDVIAQRLASASRDQQPQVLVYLDRITDAFNIGAIARNAVFFGVDTLLLSDGCSPINNVVASTSAGAIDQLQLFRASSSSLILCAEQFGEKRLSILAGCLPTLSSKSSSSSSSSSSKSDVTDLNDIVRSDVNVVVFGSEGKGVAKSLLNSQFVKRFYISGGARGGVKSELDSLNVAVSCGITLHALSKK